MSNTQENFEQNLPISNEQPSIWDLVIEEMRKRDRKGRSVYGTPLQAHNGRNSLLDLMEELLDGTAYAYQCRLELSELRRDLLTVLSLESASDEVKTSVQRILEKNTFLRE